MYEAHDMKDTFKDTTEAWRLQTTCRLYVDDIIHIPRSKVVDCTQLNNRLQPAHRLPEGDLSTQQSNLRMFCNETK